MLRLEQTIGHIRFRFFFFFFSRSLLGKKKRKRKICRRLPGSFRSTAQYSTYLRDVFPLFHAEGAGAVPFGSASPPHGPARQFDGT